MKTQLRSLLLARGTGLLSCLLLAGCCTALTESAWGKSTPVIWDRPVVVTVTGVSPEDTSQGRSVRFETPIASDNSFKLVGAESTGSAWDLDYLNIQGNADPFTSLNYAVTNNAAVPLLFSISVTLPIVPEGPLTLHGGSIGGALTDANFNGIATVATSAGVPFYRGQIDGATVLSIYPHLSTVTVGTAGGTLNLPALNPGLPGPTLPSGPATTTIGIINQFLLSPGDQFSANSFFVVIGVPEPSTIALLGICLLTLGNRRSR